LVKGTADGLMAVVGINLSPITAHRLLPDDNVRSATGEQNWKKLVKQIAEP